MTPTSLPPPSRKTHAPNFFDKLGACLGGRLDELGSEVKCSRCPARFWRSKKDVEACKGGDRAEHICASCTRYLERCVWPATRDPTSSQPKSPVATSTLPKSPVRSAGRVVRTVPLGRSQLAAAEDLGVGVETYRELVALQSREISNEDYDVLLRLHAKPNTRTLEADAIKKLPRFVCVKTSENCGENCAVCMEAMAVGEKLTRLPCAAGHVFHHQCISEWYAESPPPDPPNACTCMRRPRDARSVAWRAHARSLTRTRACPQAGQIVDVLPGRPAGPDAQVTGRQGTTRGWLPRCPCRREAPSGRCRGLYTSCILT